MRTRVFFAHFGRAFVPATLSAVLFCTATAKADLVDDLLAGKPVNIPAETATAGATPETRTSDAPSEHVVVSEETPLKDSSALEVKLPTSPILESSSDQVASMPPAPLSLVPEPSAIVLASLALAYFFVFFRRRYA